VEEIDDFGRTGLRGSFFFKIQNPPSFGELKNCFGGGCWRLYMNSSNSIYVVKFKIYQP